MPASALSDNSARGTDIWKLFAGTASSESQATNGVIGAMYLTGAGFTGSNTPGLAQANVKVEPYLVPMFGKVPACNLQAWPTKWATEAVANTPKIHTRFRVSAVFTSICESLIKTQLEVEYLRQHFITLLRNAADPTNATFANFGFTTSTTFSDSVVYGTGWGIEFYQDQDYGGGALRWFEHDGGGYGASDEVTAEIGIWRT